LELAITNKIKVVHYVSSISVLSGYNAKETFLSDSSIPPWGGYGQSKWVSERILSIAHSRGIPITIYRVGTVSGNSITGHFNSEAFFNRLWLTLIQMKVFPDNVERYFNLIPVDYIAKAISYFVVDKPHNYGNVYHLVNSDTNDISLQQLAAYIRNFGYKVRGINYEAWISKLKHNSTLYLYPLISSYFHYGFPHGISGILKDNAASHLPSVKEITQEHIHKYIKSAIGKKLLPKPYLET